MDPSFLAKLPFPSPVPVTWIHLPCTAMSDTRAGSHPADPQGIAVEPTVGSAPAQTLLLCHLKSLIWVAWYCDCQGLQTSERGSNLGAAHSKRGLGLLWYPVCSACGAVALSRHYQSSLNCMPPVLMNVISLLTSKSPSSF